MSQWSKKRCAGWQIELRPSAVLLHRVISTLSVRSTNSSWKHVSEIGQEVLPDQTVIDEYEAARRRVFSLAEDRRELPFKRTPSQPRPTVVNREVVALGRTDSQIEQACISNTHPGTVPMLKEYLKKKGESVSGRKKTLIDRIKAYVRREGR